MPKLEYFKYEVLPMGETELNVERYDKIVKQNWATIRQRTFESWALLEHFQDSTDFITPPIEETFGICDIL